MIKPTLTTWIISIFGVITFLPLFGVQLLVLLKPHSQMTKDLIIAKGKDWRDKTHLRYSLAFAWADLLIILPLLFPALLGFLEGTCGDIFYGLC